MSPRGAQINSQSRSGLCNRLHPSPRLPNFRCDREPKHRGYHAIECFGGILEWRTDQKRSHTKKDARE